MYKKEVFVALVVFMFLIVFSNLASASTTVTDISIATTGNLTVGEKITFTLGEIIDNIVNGWIRITGDLNVTGNATISGTSLKVNDQEVCLADGTNCQSFSDTMWNITTSSYVYNNSGILEVNESKLNATIEALDNDTTYTNGSGISLVGTQFNHSDTSSQASSDNSGRTYIQDITLDGFGHLTGLATAIETVTDTQKSAGSDYLYNDSTTIYLNETVLNSTINALENDTTYSHLSNFTDDILWTAGFNSTGDSRWGGAIYVSKYTSGNFNGSIYTTGADPSASNSTSIFQVIGSDGTPRFQVQDGGASQASFIARSFLVVNQNSTRLNLSQNNLCSDWGFSYIDCNSSTTGADMGVQDDFEVQGLMFADDGICSDTSLWGSYLTLGNLTTYASGGVDGEFTDATDIYCDYVSDPFTQAQVGNETWIQVTNGTYEGAQALMKTFINSSCIKLSANPAWNSDLTGQTFRIKPRPVFIISDGGFGGFYVGSDTHSKFEIKIENGSDFSGMIIDDTAGSDQHKSLIIDTDAKNHTGILGLNNFFRSSTGGSNLDLVGYYGEFSPSGIDNSDFSFMEFHHLGSKGTNNVRVFDIFGDYSEIMRHEEVEALDYVGYYNGAVLINITANATSSSTDMEIFSNDDDEIYVCDSVNLSEIAVNLQTPSSIGLRLNYYYYASDGTWKSLSATDTTNDFTITGSIRWATPSDMNLTTTDDHSHNIGASYYCIMFKRTRNNVVTPPVEDFFLATGAVQFLLRDDLIKLTPVSAPPVTCDTSYDGAIYYDSDVQFHCSCKAGTGWEQMNDATPCS